MSGFVPGTGADAALAPASLELRSAQRAFAAWVEERAHAGEFRSAQLRSAAARTLSALSADDRSRLSRWLSLQLATRAAGEGDATLNVLSRMDAWLAARVRGELPQAIAALLPATNGAVAALAMPSR